jgi:hypothetical protein
MKSGGLLRMSQRDIERDGVIRRTCEGALKQSQAAKKLNLSTRQIRRLCKGYRQAESQGLLHKGRGKPSNRRISEALRSQIIGLASSAYLGFGPTFMAEKLAEKNQIKIGKEALRLLLIKKGYWKPARQKIKTIHQQRERRSCFGELIQIDGSPHDWFEGRGPKCCLIVFIDDATSEILYLHFEKAETTFAYFRGLLHTINIYGIPLNFYSDCHGIFRVNQCDDPEAQTQFGRACEELGIELINARSPQAKGRVERANKTLQDRLTKELRLENISDIDAANRFLEEKYRKKHNERFAQAAKETQNLFTPNTRTPEELSHILSEQDKRKITKNLEISFNGKIYQIQNEGKGRRLQQGIVTVCKTLDNKINLLYKGENLEHKEFNRDKKRPRIVDGKELNPTCDEKLNSSKPWKPCVSHPWRKLRIHKTRPSKNLAQARL